MNTLLSSPDQVASGLAVRTDGEWRLLAAQLPLPPCPPPDPEALLRWNGCLGGAAKFVLAGDLSALLRAELPWLASTPEPAQPLLEATQSGLLDGIARWSAGVQAGAEAAAPPLLPTPGVVVAGFLEVCAAAGWPPTATDGAAPTIALGTGDGSGPVRLFAEPGRVLCFAGLAEVSAESPVVLAAVARCLLMNGERLRWARPSLRADGERAWAGFEVLLPTEAGADLVALALGSLFAGVRLCGAELGELRHEPVARDYLANACP